MRPSRTSRTATRPARAHVVDLARRAPRHQAHVGADDVADVGEVAARGEVADLQHRLGHAPRDGRDLPGEVRREVVGALARPEMVERAADDDLDRRRRAGMAGHHLLRQLAQRVRARRPQRRVLAGRGVARLVDEAGARDQRPRVRRMPGQRAQQVIGAHRVDAQDVGRLRERLALMGRAGEVVDVVRRIGGDRGVHRAGVEEVDAAPGDAGGRRPAADVRRGGARPRRAARRRRPASAGDRTGGRRRSRRRR